VVPRGHAQQIDLNDDGMGDVWQLFYSATGVASDGDEDGDGYSNGEESLAGTDPFNIDSVLGFKEFVADGGERELTWASVAGKKYFLQSSGDLISWDVEQDAFYGSGGDMTLKMSNGDAGGMLVGAVKREVWRDAPGTTVASLTSLPAYPDSPSGVHALAKLECPINDADNFGARVTGYIIAPRTGPFSFSLSSRHDSQFALSTDSSRANLRVIATASGSGTIGDIGDVVVGDAQVRQLAVGLSQPINLVAGEIYYFRLLHKGGVGEDSCSVSWKVAGQAQYSVIAGRFLAAWLGAGDPADAKRRFYRLDVTDSDADADGATDWEELQVSYDPFDKDSAVGGEPDGETLTAALTATTSTVEIAAVDAEGFEEEDGGTDPEVAKFKVTRSGVLTPVTVFYAESGDAVSGEDFETLPGFVTFGFGENEVEFDVTPVADSYLEVPEELSLMLDTTYQEYEVGVNGTAEVVLQDYEDQREALFVAQLGAEGSVQTSASGLSSIRLAGGHTSCLVSLSFSGLTSAQTAAHIHAVDGGSIVEGFTELGQIMNHQWDFPETGQGIFTSDQELLDALQGGGLYVNVHSSTFPAGEIRGDYALVEGSIEFTPPSDPPPISAYEGDDLERDVARLLTQATFGPTDSTIDAVVAQGLEAWIDEQMDPVATVPSSLLNYVEAADLWEIDNAAQNGDPNFDPNHLNRRRGWWLMALKGEDQLRQRVAFALSEILVVSEENSRVRQKHEGAADYYDMLSGHAFGNFRDLLEDVTLHPIMGWYLSMIQNEKANGVTQPDENYAREVMQLFSIGLLELHPDGSLKLDPQTLLPIQTYDNFLITELARVFTGWSFSVRDDGSVNNQFNYFGGNNQNQASWKAPMKMFQTFHDEGGKQLVYGDPIPPSQSGEMDMDDAMDALFEHPNTGPFIARRLIQRLVTSNPSRGYVYRVAQVFDDNGSGVRGDLGAVVKAILLDYEARSQEVIETVTFGRQKEPIVRYTALLRAFDAKSQLPLSDFEAFGFNNTYPAGSTRYRFFQTDSSLGQSPLAAPSVFNWFLPDYVNPGALADAGLVVPEFQITTETTVVRTTNHNRNLTDGGNGQNGSPVPGDTDQLLDNIKLDRTAMENYLDANGTVAFVDYLDKVMTARTMSAETRVILEATIDDHPNSEQKVKVALYLLSSVPDFLIQR